MKLHELFKGIDVEKAMGPAETEISGISYDSRKCLPGHLFVCIRGFQTDGHDYARQAVERGAVAVASERELDLPAEINQLVCTDNRRNLPLLASNFYDKPSGRLRLLGVTGTNGKTTTTHLLQFMLNESGRQAAIIGTLYASIGNYQRDLGHTTPESTDIEDFLDYSLKQGASHAIMEVSSHAVELGRVSCLDFNAAILTNLTQDHLDFHGDMDSYRRAKQKFFLMIEKAPGNYVIINADDPSARDFAGVSTARIITYGIEQPASIMARNIKSSLKESTFDLVYGDRSVAVRTGLIGKFSVYNALAATAAAIQEGVDFETVLKVLAGTRGVSGRFEQVECGQDFTVVVDYAHTPDGLENILKTGRELAGKRLITVFGCGGDRDRGKRPQMGRIASRYSDFCVVTSDNPRSEEPSEIIAEITAGMKEAPAGSYIEIIDRAQAIRHAIFMASKGDLVVIAGKGHENYQLIKDKVLDFDDRQVASRIIQERIKRAD